MKKTAKFASSMAVTVFEDFESKLDFVHHDYVNFTDALDDNKIITKADTSNCFI